MNTSQIHLRLRDGTECVVSGICGFVLQRVSVEPLVLALRLRGGQEAPVDLTSLAPVDSRVGHEISLAFVECVGGHDRWVVGSFNHKTGQAKRTLHMRHIFEHLVVDPMRGHKAFKGVAAVAAASLVAAAAAALGLALADGGAWRAFFGTIGLVSCLGAAASIAVVRRNAEAHREIGFREFDQLVGAATTQLLTGRVRAARAPGQGPQPSTAKPSGRSLAAPGVHAVQLVS